MKSRSRKAVPPVPTVSEGQLIPYCRAPLSKPVSVEPLVHSRGPTRYTGGEGKVVSVDEVGLEAELTTGD